MFYVSLTHRTHGIELCSIFLSLLKLEIASFGLLKMYIFKHLSLDVIHTLLGTVNLMMIITQLIGLARLADSVSSKIMFTKKKR